MMVIMTDTYDDVNPDRLARRQAIIDGFKTPRQFAERIIQLEDECRAIRAEFDNRWQNAGDQPCHFPEHRGKFGHVTHIRYLGSMEGYNLECCEVCGTVRACEPVALASA